MSLGVRGAEPRKGGKGGCRVVFSRTGLLCPRTGVGVLHFPDAAFSGNQESASNARKGWATRCVPCFVAPCASASWHPLLPVVIVAVSSHTRTSAYRRWSAHNGKVSTVGKMRRQQKTRLRTGLILRLLSSWSYSYQNGMSSVRSSTDTGAALC